MENQTTLTERHEALELKGWKYIYDGRSFFSGIWRNDIYDCVLNYGGGSYENITDAIIAAETFDQNMAQVMR